MQLYRLKLRPLSPWQTPWQADTLSGLLARTLVQWEGSDALQNEIFLPASAGNPPFVLSDAFPGDLLPVPLALRLRPWRPEERKTVKQARYISGETLQKWRRGNIPQINDLLPVSHVLSAEQMRNTISRATGTTQEEGSLFSSEASALAGGSGQPDTLSVYVRVAQNYKGRLMQLFHRLSLTGYGADASVGYGQFEITSGLEPLPEWDATASAAGGSHLLLGSCSPAANDPTDGVWELFTKSGKLGPDFGITNIWKRPMALLRPGACLASDANRLFMGRVLPMEAFLPSETVRTLVERDINVFHYAFGLLIPVPTLDFNI